MRCRQGVRYLDADVEHLLRRQRVSGYALLQALALELLHHDEGMPVVILNAMNCADVGMIQKRRGPCLAGETFQRFGVAGEIFRNELQSNVAPELEVLGFIHHSHATPAQLPKDAIVGYSLANHERSQPPNAVMLGPPAT